LLASTAGRFSSWFWAEKKKMASFPSPVLPKRNGVNKKKNLALVLGKKTEAKRKKKKSFSVE
jgi:hypothetical protein